MKMRSWILCCSSALVLVFLLGFAVPWWMGEALHRNIVKNFHRLDKIYPGCQFTLKNYQKGIYTSKAILEIVSKSQYKDSPKIHLVLDETIKHGPFIFDVPNKALHCKLAKIESTVQLKETPFIKFDQQAFQFTSSINYLWKLDFSTHIEELSGQLFVSEKLPCRMEINDLSLEGELALTHLKLVQNLAIEKLALFYSKDTRVQMNQVAFHNELDASHSILDHANDSFGCNGIEITHNKDNVFIYHPKIHLNTKTENKPNFLAIDGNVVLNQIIANDLGYGPLNAQFMLKHIPKDFLDDSEKMEQLLNSENIRELQALILKQLKDENIALILKDISLHVPGGLVSLKGELNLHVNEATKPNPENTSIVSYINGKLIASAPKQTLIRIFRNEVIEPFLKMGLLLETDNTFDLYCILKKNSIFINGSNLEDHLFTKSFNLFKRPLTKEQRFLLALLEEDNDTLRKLIQEGVAFNRPLIHGKYPIHIASHMGNLSAIKLLLESDHAIDVPDEEGNSALYWASRGGHTDVVRLLVAKKANVNAKNLHGWTPLQEAAENGHQDAVLLLLDKGAKINTQDNDGRTALFWAAKEGHVSVIELLLEKGADPSLNNVRNLTPLDIAKEYGREKAVAVLKSASRPEKNP